MYEVPGVFSTTTCTWSETFGYPDSLQVIFIPFLSSFEGLMFSEISRTVRHLSNRWHVSPRKDSVTP